MQSLVLNEVGTNLDLPNNAIQAIQFTLEFTIARIDDWKNVVPEGKGLQRECEVFQNLIKDLLQYRDLPISKILKDVNNTMISTNILISKFLKEEDEKRSVFNEINYNIKRVYYSYTYRQTFNEATKNLQSSKTKIKEIIELSKLFNKPTIFMYSNHIDHKSLVFWKEMFGEDINSPGDFDFFISKHNSEYGYDWNYDDRERIRRIACTNERDFNISGYIHLIKTCGFPIKVEKLPSLIDSKSIESVQIRMEVAKMVNELISYFSTKEMRDSIVSVFKWYKDVNKKNKKEWQEKANLWARTISEMHKKDPKNYTNDEHLADSVDIARRTYSFFFQRYMVIYKIGKVSKETFGNVDFPGKARIFEFIEYFEPLDKANFLVVMNKPPEKWIDKKPKVYTFLRSEILKIEDPDLQLKKEIS